MEVFVLALVSLCAVVNGAAFLSFPHFPNGVLPARSDAGIARQVTITCFQGKKKCSKRKRIFTGAFKGGPYSYDPASQKTVPVVSDPASSRITITIPNAPAVPVQLYVLQWPVGTYTFNIPFRKRSSTKQSKIGALNKTIHVFGGNGKQFSGILEFPRGTTKISWIGVKAKNRVKYTLAYGVPIPIPPSPAPTNATTPPPAPTPPPCSSNPIDYPIDTNSFADPATDLAVGDYDKDNVPDFLIGSNNGNVVGLFYTNPASWKNPKEWTTAPTFGDQQPLRVKIGDLNQDTLLDLVSGDFSGAGGGATVTLNSVNPGIFFPPSTVNTGAAGTVGVAIGDVNHDLWPDLVTINHGAISVMYGIIQNPGGQAIYNPATQYTFQSSFINLKALLVFDFDLDTNLDVITADFGANKVVVVFGDSMTPFPAFIGVMGGVSNPVSTPVGTQPVAIASGDFDLNTYPDIVCVNSADNTITILLNVGGHSSAYNNNLIFQTPTVHPVGANPQSVAVGSLNGDAFLDIAVVNTGDNTLSVFFGDSTGRFISNVVVSPLTAALGNPMNVQSVAIADVNADQKPDLIVLTASFSVDSGSYTNYLSFLKNCN